MISAPLRTRFGITERLEYYTDQELADIVTQSARYLSIVIDTEAALHIGKCSRGTPRIAKKLLRRVRDFAQVKHIHTITIDITREAFQFLGIDDDGLNRLIICYCKNGRTFNGGPVGLETLACSLGKIAKQLKMSMNLICCAKVIWKKQHGPSNTSYKITCAKKTIFRTKNNHLTYPKKSATALQKYIRYITLWYSQLEWNQKHPLKEYYVRSF
jgi:Holliday junction resolvasome RuvABC ATP-dependent DNA helicase subunit